MGIDALLLYVCKSIHWMSCNAGADGLKELQAQAKKKANQAKKVPIRRMLWCCFCCTRDYDGKTLVLFPKGWRDLDLYYHSFGIILYYLVFLLFVNLNAWSYAMISLASNQSASSFSDVIKRRKVTLCLAMKVWEGEGSESQRLFSLCSQYSASFIFVQLQFLLLVSLAVCLNPYALGWFGFLMDILNCVWNWVCCQLRAHKPDSLSAEGRSEANIYRCFWYHHWCGMPRITSYRSRLRFQRPRKGTLPTMKSRSERVETYYRKANHRTRGKKTKIIQNLSLQR